MHPRHTLVALTVAAFALPATARADTATELRLQSIESRLPDVSRLATLEKKVQRLAQAEGVEGDGSGRRGGDVVFNLYQDVQALTEDVRRLRGEIDEIKHRADQREQRQRDLYENLDQRLLALERKVGIKEGGDGSDTGDDENGRSSDSGDSAEAEEVYLAAFEQLKGGDYAKARESFQSFVDNYPDSDYGDNAWYWLGEARYVDRQYDEALAAFQRVVDDYPGSQKVPGALYKRGVILDEQGKYDAARDLLREVIDEYPDDNAAELARKRLDAMGGS